MRRHRSVSQRRPTVPTKKMANNPKEPGKKEGLHVVGVNRDRSLA